MIRALWGICDAHGSFFHQRERDSLKNRNASLVDGREGGLGREIHRLDFLFGSLLIDLFVTQPGAIRVGFPRCRFQILNSFQSVKDLVLRHVNELMPTNVRSTKSGRSSRSRDKFRSNRRPSSSASISQPCVLKYDAKTAKNGTSSRLSR